MRKMTRKQKKLADAIGIACGALILIVAIVTGIIKARPAVVGAGAGDIPNTAQHLVGTAEGRNGPITVEVVADENMIYSINVSSHQETDGIGSIAVERLPGMIYEAQSLEVDSVSGATLSSDAIKAAVLNALESGGLSTDSFGGENVVAAAPVKMASRVVKRTALALPVLRMERLAAEMPIF